jgi:hypothetical protein
MPIDADQIGVHMSHCFCGEYPDTCKYGDDDECPARPVATFDKSSAQGDLIQMQISPAESHLIRRLLPPLIDASNEQDGLLLERFLDRLSEANVHAASNYKEPA